jgi:hypothetical protein
MHHHRTRSVIQLKVRYVFIAVAAKEPTEEPDVTLLADVHFWETVAEVWVKLEAQTGYVVPLLCPQHGYPIHARLQD